SGHDGTYAVKKEFFEASMKIVRPVAGRVKKAEPDHYGSDCPMAGHHVAQGVGDGSDAEHPITLLRKAYGI
ncbi:MAG: Fe-S oxidoreductase, partial [Deltaproteobacteria bacterium]|nr:Fe-S oxidoreductase [Deltaproteobacteria bacterium]